MRVVHCKKESFDVYIGRPGEFGNPFKVGPHGFIEQVLEKFEAYARECLMELIAELPANTVLGCWCSPGPCHGDIIIKLWNEIHNVKLKR